MEQFSLEKYLENPTRKVVTREGRPVRIVCWDLKSNTPIIAAIQWNQEREDCYCYNTIGRCANNVGELDLFFADEEKELTEFEKAIKKLIESCCNEVEEANITNAGAKEISSHILDLARKEIEKENPKQEWSKEDKSMYIRTLGILGKCYMGVLPTEVEEELRWLKSIEPQSQWKPSKDQMFALSMHIRENPNLESLYNDLKKL